MAAHVLQEYLDDADREHFVVLLLDVQDRTNGVHTFTVELLVDVGEQASIRRLRLAEFAESSTFRAARIRNLTAPRPRGWRILVGITVAVVALALAAACEPAAPIITVDPAARARDDRLGLGPEASELIAAVESEGAGHPRPERVRSYAPHPRTARGGTR